jgi:hypothetical protein
MSGYGEAAEEADGARSAGTVLLKPFDQHRLARAVRESLDRGETRPREA